MSESRDVWLEVDNDHETGKVTVEVWNRSEPLEKVFQGEVTAFRWDGPDAVVELRNTDNDTDTTTGGGDVVPAPNVSAPTVGGS